MSTGTRRDPRQPQLEAGWQTDVIRLATLLGWLNYHTHDSRSSASGFPDLVLVRGDRVVYVELKRAATVKGSQLSAAQLVWLQALENAGEECYVARPEHLELVQLILASRCRPAAHLVADLLSPKG